MNHIKKSVCVLLVLMLSISNIAVSAEDNISIEYVLNDTAKYVYETVKNPQVGSIGGEWAVLGLARSGYDVPEQYYQNYYKNVEEYVNACNGNLHNKKYTEYSRLIVALTSIGKNPGNVAGYNLLTPLGDYEKTIWQGMNGPIWALIALDSGNYDMPQNSNAKVQATREMYIERILNCQLSDGGWSLFGGTAAQKSGDGISDPDITGMALCALSKYQDDEKVKTAIEKALDCMSERQNEKGGFSSWNTENSESCVQMIVALCELGIPLTDTRFVKNGNTMLDSLLGFYVEGNGFLHTYDGSGSNLMSTEQAFYGIVAVKRANDGKNSLYTMSDAIHVSEMKNETTIGLPEKNPDIKKMNIVAPGKTFPDISAHLNQPAIEALASRGIINGKAENSFEPDSTMTRAEFATIIVNSLGLSLRVGSYFKDVEPGDWFCDYVATAYDYGLIKGISDTQFNPYGIITREEAAVMVVRGAKLCGMNIDMTDIEVRDVLSQFFDYVKASEWSRGSLAFCYKEGILPDDGMEIKPFEPVTRGEIASMLFNMLKGSELL